MRHLISSIGAARCGNSQTRIEEVDAVCDYFMCCRLFFPFFRLLRLELRSNAARRSLTLACATPRPARKNAISTHSLLPPPAATTERTTSLNALWKPSLESSGRIQIGHVPSSASFAFIGPCDLLKPRHNLVLSQWIEYFSVLFGESEWRCMRRHFRAWTVFTQCMKTLYTVFYFRLSSILLYYARSCCLKSVLSFQA